jgi:hypothetical protein
MLNEELPPGGTDSLVVLLHPEVVWPEQPGLYSEGGRVLQDEIEDVHCFLFPIQRTTRGVGTMTFEMPTASTA